MKHYIGIDLGGTNTKIGIVDAEGNLINSKIIKTNSHLNVDKTLERIWETAKKLVSEKEIPLFSVVGIGIGIPGPVKNQSTVGFFANFDWERNLNLKEKMENLSGIETRVENDVNIIAQGEAIFGAAKGKKSSITIAIGTGIGGGIFYNGNLISGMSGVGGEIGHMKVVKDGKTCGCGQNGCFEAYASASSLVKEAQERSKLNDDNLLFKEINGNLDELEAKNIFDTARKGDEFSKDLIEYESDYLALGIGNLLNIINPECIVISGGISLAGDEILLPVKEKLKKYTMPPALENLEIKVGVLGNEAGIKGAVALFI